MTLQKEDGKCHLLIFTFFVVLTSKNPLVAPSFAKPFILHINQFFKNAEPKSVTPPTKESTPDAMGPAARVGSASV